jgi:hypothetical protein
MDQLRYIGGWVVHVFVASLVMWVAALVGVVASAAFEASDYNGPHWGDRLFHIALGLGIVAMFPYALVRLRRRRAMGVRYQEITAHRR